VDRGGRRVGVDVVGEGALDGQGLCDGSEVGAPNSGSFPRHPLTRPDERKQTRVDTIGSSEALVGVGIVEVMKRYTYRFVLVYTALGIILAAALTGLIVLVIAPGHRAAPPWSTWKPPSGSSQKVAAAIADHVARRYRLSETGGQLAAVIAGPPQVTSGTQNIAIKAVAVRKAPQSNTGIAIYGTDRTKDYTLCGLGARCSIAGGKATVPRGLLVRREALELALYTFKFVPSIDSIAAFMPPPPGQTSSSILYLDKTDLEDQLHQPLDKTLPLDTPPLPTAADKPEQATIDKLTLPHMFTYKLTALQTGGAALVLDPAT
jgi:hypothetical protein